MSSYWEQDEEKRIAARAVQEAGWQRRMEQAGGIDPDEMSEQGRRILVWLTKWDEWTVGGIEELFSAARRAGVEAATRTPDRPERDQPADRFRARLDALGHEAPAVEL